GCAGCWAAIAEGAEAVGGISCVRGETPGADADGAGAAVGGAEGPPISPWTYLACDSIRLPCVLPASPAASTGAIEENTERLGTTRMEFQSCGVWLICWLPCIKAWASICLRCRSRYAGYCDGSRYGGWRPGSGIDASGHLHGIRRLRLRHPRRD